VATTRPAADIDLRRAPVAPRRAKYEPMAHPGNQRRWDRDAILAALKEWVAQTGSIPRRIDWCGERPVHAGAGQRKWMREHPWWPSSSCVVTHCGSWSAALEAAGLPARSLTFETSVAERVASARRLAAGGTTIREIAGALGVSVSSVHNYLNAVDCPDCGRPCDQPARPTMFGLCESRADDRSQLDARGRSGRGSRVVRGTRSGAVIPGLDAVALGREPLGGAESALAQRSGCLRSLQRAAEPLERCSRRRRRPRPFPPLERRGDPRRAGWVLDPDRARAA
jgi:hypothetical protein